MWFLPSTERPERFALALAGIERTAPDVGLCVLLRSGDEQLDRYREIIAKSSLKPTVQFHGHYGCARIWQFAYLMYPKEPFYGFVADDLEFLTEGWDQRLQEAAGSWKMAWADDGIHSGRIPTHYALGGELVRAVGYWGPPGFFHNCIDGVWQEIVGQAGLGEYCSDVKFRHNHWVLNKALKDRIYEMVVEKHVEDIERFDEYTGSLEFTALLDRVKRSYVDASQEQEAA
jgi:hypothetical protein